MSIIVHFDRDRRCQMHMYDAVKTHGEGTPTRLWTCLRDREWQRYCAGGPVCKCFQHSHQFGTSDLDAPKCNLSKPNAKESRQRPEGNVRTTLGGFKGVYGL
jgi:hypothetical protein